MACVPQLFAAALAAASPAGGVPGAAIYTSPLPACDQLGLADEEGEIAALDLLREGEPLTPAAGFDTRDCRVPDRKAPAIVDCNDARSGVWVHEMVGSCDMPPMRPYPSLRGVPRDRSHLPLATVCAGASCTDDTLPLRSASRSGSDAPWMALESMAPPAPLPARALELRTVLEPESASLDRWLRPPIA